MKYFGTAAIITIIIGIKLIMMTKPKLFRVEIKKCSL